MLREEFSRKHFALKFHRVDVFSTAQWRWHQAVFTLYRLVMAAYTLFAFIHMLVVTQPGVRVLAFLTIWTYLVEMLFFITGAMLAILHCLYPHRFRFTESIGERSGIEGQQNYAFYGGTERSGGSVLEDYRPGRSENADRGGDDAQRAESFRRSRLNVSLPWYVQVHWALGNIIQVFAPVVTVIYFAVLYPELRDTIGDVNLMSDVNLHGVSSVMVLLDIAISARPVRLLHVLYPVVYGVAYVIFSVIFWAADPVNNVLYPNVLDWNQPGLSIGVILGLALIGIPLVQLAIFGLYQLRLKVFRMIYGEEYL